MSFSPFHASSQILSPPSPPREFPSQTVDLSHLQFCFSRFQLPMVNYSLEISPTIRYLERERDNTSYNFYYSILLYLFYLINSYCINTIWNVSATHKEGLLYANSVLHWDFTSSYSSPRLFQFTL